MSTERDDAAKAWPKKFEAANDDGDDVSVFEWAAPEDIAADSFKAGWEAQSQEALDVAVKALEYYMNHIPYFRPVTPESAAYEKEFGSGRKAREALEQVRKLLAGDRSKEGKEPR
jgi:hypothetical protein